MFYYGIDPLYLILVMPAILLATYAQINVSSTFSKYSQKANRRNLTGAQAARIILDRHGLRDVAIEPIRGNLNDHYDPRSNVIRLSESVYASSSVAAVGVAAHEAGHAVQHAEKYYPVMVRNAIYPVVSICSSLTVPAIILGFILNWSALINFAILLFTGVVAFQLITLPVEFNASNRAKEVLEAHGILYEDEIGGVRKVLTAAAMTYIAAALVSLMQLLRFILLAGGGSRRDD